MALMVHGTNNLKSDGTTTILKKYYDELIRTAKEKRIRNITVVGIVCRNDVGVYHECKRYAINAKLKKKCELMPDGCVLCGSGCDVCTRTEIGCYAEIACT